MSDNAHQIESIFAGAVALPTDQRSQFLDAQCADSPQLRQQIDALLRAHDKANHLLDRPLAGVNQTAIHTSQIQHPGEIIAGRYKLLEQIGVGGMGAVWMAEQKEPVKRKVAVKLVKAGMDSAQVLARFEAERQALALMDHPNIAKVFDGGVTEQGRPFFVMEFVKGVPLTEYCNEARLSLKERLNLFIPVCQAVQHAHQKGIIHRDLKPSNILICLYDGKPVPKVIDFGLAKAMHQSLTENTIHTAFGMMVGTPLYMSPEQAEHNNLDVDTRADIYSLGVILYELLTGTTPLEQKQLKEAAYNEILRLIKEVEPPKPSTRLSGSTSLPSIAAQRSIDPKQLSKSLTGDLDWIVMKSLDKERSRRYETANGLARDVERFLNDEAVEASPPSSSYRLRKLIMKHRTAISTAAAFAGVLVLGTAVSVWLAVRATKAEGDAKQALVAEAKQRTLAEKNEGIANEQRIKAEDAVKKEAEQRRIAEEQKLKAEQAEAATLADYRSITDESVEQLIGSKENLGLKERAYLENTIKRWQAFANRQGVDERSQAIRGEGHFRVGTLWRALGRNEEARAEYMASIDIYKKLSEQFPIVPGYQKHLASSQINLGSLHQALGKREHAHQAYREGCDVLKKLVERFPSDLIYQLDLASAHNNLGTLLSEIGRQEESRLEFEIARNLEKALEERSESTPELLRMLALTRGNLAGLLSNIGKYEEARDEFQATREVLKTLADRFRDAPEYQHDLAGIHYNLGCLLPELGKIDEALAEYDAAFELQRKLAAGFPSIPMYRSVLAATLHNRGHLLARIGKTDQAQADYESARDIGKKLVLEFPELPEYRDGLASTHDNLGGLQHKLGNFTEARSEYQAAADIQKMLANQFPARLEYKVGLAGSYCNYGQVVSDGGNPAESLPWFNLAIHTLKGVLEKEPRDLTAKSYLRNSHVGQAIVPHQLKAAPESCARV